MLREITIDNKYTKNYANKANAVKAIEKELAKYNKAMLCNFPMRYIVIINNDRYVPIVFPDKDQIQLSMEIARSGFKVIG